jgi:hypothetical protein
MNNKINDFKKSNDLDNKHITNSQKPKAIMTNSDESIKAKEISEKHMNDLKKKHTFINNTFLNSKTDFKLVIAQSDKSLNKNLSTISNYSDFTNENTNSSKSLRNTFSFSLSKNYKFKKKDIQIINDNTITEDMKKEEKSKKNI